MTKPAAKTAPARKTVAPPPAPRAQPAARGVDPRQDDDTDGDADRGNASTTAAAPPTPTNESAATANDASTAAGNEGGAPPVDPAVVVRRRVIGADQELVKVSVPRGFRVDDGTGVHEYPAGTEQMPAEHADHWYAKAHGVQRK